MATSVTYADVPKGYTVVEPQAATATMPVSPAYSDVPQGFKVVTSAPAAPATQPAAAPVMPSAPEPEQENLIPGTFPLLGGERPTVAHAEYHPMPLAGDTQEQTIRNAQRTEQIAEGDEKWRGERPGLVNRFGQTAGAAVGRPAFRLAGLDKGEANREWMPPLPFRGPKATPGHGLYGSNVPDNWYEVGPRHVGDSPYEIQASEGRGWTDVSNPNNQSRLLTPDELRKLVESEQVTPLDAQNYLTTLNNKHRAMGKAESQIRPDMPIAAGFGEKFTDISANVVGCVAQFILTKKFIPIPTNYAGRTALAAREIATWAAVDKLNSGTGAQGAAMGTVLQGVSQIPVGGWKGLVLKSALDFAVFAGESKAHGGDTEASISNGLIPVVIRALGARGAFKAERKNAELKQLRQFNADPGVSDSVKMAVNSILIAAENNKVRVEIPEVIQKAKASESEAIIQTVQEEANPVKTPAAPQAESPATPEELAAIHERAGVAETPASSEELARMGVKPKPAAPQAAKGPEGPSNTDILAFAKQRLAKLQPPSMISTIGPDGKPIIGPNPDFIALTRAEGKERDFLRQNQNNPDAIRKAYNFDEPLTTETGSQNSTYTEQQIVDYALQREKKLGSLLLLDPNSIHELQFIRDNQNNPVALAEFYGVQMPAPPQAPVEPPEARTSPIKAEPPVAKPAAVPQPVKAAALPPEVPISAVSAEKPLTPPAKPSVPPAPEAKGETAKPTIHERAKAAQTEAGKALDDLGDMLKGKLGEGPQFLDPAILKQFVVTTAKLVKAGGLTLADALQRIHLSLAAKYKDTAKIDQIVDEVRIAYEREYDAKGEVKPPAEVPPVAETPTLPAKGEFVTSTKNAIANAEREARGVEPLPEHTPRKWTETWAEAEKIRTADPMAAPRLIDEMVGKPRTISDTENDVILQHKIMLRNQWNETANKGADAADKGDTAAAVEAKAQSDRIEGEMLVLDDVLKKVGTKAGQSLAARRKLADQDMSLVAMILRKRAVNDFKKLTPEQEAQVKAQHDQIVKLEVDKAKLQADLEAATLKTEQLGREKAFTEAARDLFERRAVSAERRATQAGRPAPTEQTPRIPRTTYGARNRVVKTAEYQSILKELASTTTLNDITRVPEFLYKVTKLGVYHIEAGIKSFADWSAKVMADVPDKWKPMVSPELKKIWENAHKEMFKADQKAIVDRAKKAVTEKADADLGDAAHRLARSFVEQGITEREALVDAVHDALKEADPSITRPEAMDAISGYGRFRQLSKDEISIQLRDLKGQMQQVGKLRDMAAGEAPKKTGFERREPTDAERQLIQLVGKAKEEGGYDVTDPATQLKSNVQSFMTRTKNRMADLQDRLARKDFAPTAKRLSWREKSLDAAIKKQILDREHELEIVKEKYNKGLFDDRMARRSIPEKIFSGGVEAINTSRAMMTSFDFSAVLRQGGFIALSHPIRAAKVFPAMFRALTKKGEFAVEQEIKGRENYPLYKRSGLELTERGTTLVKMEEAYMSRWAEKIPGVGASQRAYMTFLNKLRADSFDAMMKSLGRDGMVTDAEAKAIANYINVATGRGKLGKHDTALVGLNTLFFAPRLVLSRFQLLAGQPLYRGSWRTRRLIAGEYARYLIGIGVVYALARAMGADEEFDPRSSDFGKIRVGNTRIDPLSGLSQTAVLVGRMATGETKSIGSGKITSIYKPKFGQDNVWDVAARFARTKLSPAFGAAVNIRSGEDVVGQPVTVASTAQNLAVPMTFNDIYAALREQGIVKGTAMGLLTTFGMSLQTYEPRKPKGGKSFKPWSPAKTRATRTMGRTTRETRKP
jgi:hypothetical protein